MATSLPIFPPCLPITLPDRLSACLSPLLAHQTDSLEELEEWKEALEEAIAASPAASIMMGLPKDALFHRDNFDTLAGEGHEGTLQNTSERKGEGGRGVERERGGCFTVL